MDVSSTIREDIQEGLRMLFSVDEDVSDKAGNLAGDTLILERAAEGRNG